jgi:hypothetical protein
MIEIAEGPARVYPYRYPVISIMMPSKWINDAYEYDIWCAKVAGDTGRFRGWQSARRIGQIGFAAYFGLQDQWKENLSLWKERPPRYDYKIGGTQYKLHTAPSFDWSPNIGRSLSYKVKKIADLEPIVHIFMVYHLPYLDIIGFLPNEDLKEGMSKITDRDITTTTSHTVLKSIDTKGLYV